jgi:hypothetical protein
MDPDFCNEQITILKAQIAAYQAVLTQLSDNPNKAYSLDTGQTKETVTKKDYARINEMVRVMIGDLQFWYDCLNNTSGIIMGPAF